MSAKAAQAAQMEWTGRKSRIRIKAGHLDDVTAQQARNFAREINADVKEQIDPLEVAERGPGIGYAEVEEGEFTGFTVYGQYQW